MIDGENELNPVKAEGPFEKSPPDRCAEASLAVRATPARTATIRNFLTSNLPMTFLIETVTMDSCGVQAQRSGKFRILREPQSLV